MIDDSALKLLSITAVVFAAIIGGFFSLVNLVNAKEQKVSDLRQEWINSLRASISKYVSSLYWLSILFKSYNRQTEKRQNGFEFVKGAEESYANVNSSYNDIIFRINPNETDPDAKKINEEFLISLEKSRKLFNANEFSDIGKCCDDIREKAKPILKKEWERVKQGEPAFQKSKKMAKGVLIAGAIVYILFICAAFSSSNCKVAKNAITNNETCIHTKIINPDSDQKLINSVKSMPKTASSTP